MELRRQTPKTGKTGRKSRFAAILVAAIFGVMGAQASARAEVTFTANLDRSQIALDESVSLKLAIRSDGNNSIGEIKFNAPDFEVINEYTGNYSEYFFENGHAGMRNTVQITKVLKPLKAGALKITGIQVQVNGKGYGASDQFVQVSQAGAGTPPPKNYGGAGSALRGSAKPGQPNSVFVRAEVDKDKALKGEQVIVSYYLYHRVRVFNIQVDKFPMLNGFLREDLEMPVLGGLTSEQVILDGVPYQRSLLMRYAVYPLQEGTLKIDPVGLKYAYYVNNGAFGGDEDPFNSFFQQMIPRTGEAKSDIVNISVTPVPQDGKPQSFTGGVGDFNLSSAVDKYDVRANEPVTLTVKIEGRGNAAAVGEPKVKWPDDLELYDSKGHSKAGKGGVGEKDFEFLLIPRVPGKLTLPGMEFSYYDPSKKQYVTRTTEPIQINVQDPAPGSALVSRTKTHPGATAVGDAAKPGPEPLAALMPLSNVPARATELRGFPIWRWLYWAALAALVFFVFLVVSDVVRKHRESAVALHAVRSRAEAKSWAKLKANAKNAVNGASWQDVTRSYESLCGAIFDALDKRYKLGSRSLSRGDLKRLLVEERGLPAETWERLGKILEYAEMVRFASSTGAISETSARQELAHWVQEAEKELVLFG